MADSQSDWLNPMVAGHWVLNVRWYRLHSPSLLSLSLKANILFYHSTEDRRLSRPNQMTVTETLEAWLPYDIEGFNLD